MKKEFKNALVAVGIFASGFVAADLAVGFAGDYLRERLPDHGGEMVQTNYVITRLETDILIVGSSRAGYHYDPAIVSDSLSRRLGIPLSAYNTGRIKTRIPYYYSVLWSVMQRCTPSVVILDMNIDDLNCPPDNGLTLAMGLKPFYYTSDGVRRMCDLLDGTAPFKMLFSSFRFNTEIFKIAASLGRASAPDNNGLLVSNLAMPSEERPTVIIPQAEDPDEEFIAIFHDMISLCRSRGTTLIVAVSPLYYSGPGGSLLPADRIERICLEQGVPFFNQDHWFLDRPELFFDRTHLNSAGATAYTQRLMARVSPLFAR